MFEETSSSNRLQSWRDIRNKHYPSVDALIKQFPYANHTARFIDFYTPVSWPSAFEIVSDGQFCQSGITIVMALSLHHAGFITGEELLFPVINNNTNGNVGLVLEYEGLIYNFAEGKIVTRQEMVENSTRYTSHEVKIKHLFS